MAESNEKQPNPMVVVDVADLTDEEIDELSEEIAATLQKKSEE